MTKATYRGVSYDVEERKLCHLQRIKRQLEKAQARHDAQLAMIQNQDRSVVN